MSEDIADCRLPIVDGERWLAVVSTIRVSGWVKKGGLESRKFLYPIRLGEWY